MYRIVIFPFILVCIIAGWEKMFIIFLTISLFTDFLDGFIARMFKMQTEIGAKLDSIADIGTYILAFIGIYVYKWDVIKGHIWILITAVVLFLSIDLFSILKFGRPPSLHTYMFKSSGYLQGALIIVLFVWKFIKWFYYLALGWGILASIEEIIILMYLPKLQSNAKGLYWILKRKG